MPKRNLFERIGGRPAVVKAVDLFYKKNLLDHRVRHYFTDLDLKTLKEHQVTFLTHLFGGLPHYSGRSLHLAHKDLVENKGLNDSHFDAIAENLHQTLIELDVDKNLIAEACQLIEKTREIILRGHNT